MRQAQEDLRSPSAGATPSRWPGINLSRSLPAQTGKQPHHPAGNAQLLWGFHWLHGIAPAEGLGRGLEHAVLTQGRGEVHG